VPVDETLSSTTLKRLTFRPEHYGVYRDIFHIVHQSKLPVLAMLRMYFDHQDLHWICDQPEDAESGQELTMSEGDMRLRFSLLKSVDVIIDPKRLNDHEVPSPSCLAALRRWQFLNVAAEFKILQVILDDVKI
jgi:hypothetical protein